MADDLKRVFVSFAVPDAGLANALVNFLRLGCDLAEKQVFMTDRPGTLPPGTDFSEAIREALDGSDMAILLLTPSYYDSAFCLAEAGAVWVQKKVHVPLLVPPNDFADLEGVQLGKQAERIDSPSDLDEIRDLIAEVTGQKVSTGSWNRHKEEFLNRWTVEFEESVQRPELVPMADLREVQGDKEELSRRVSDLEDENRRIAEFTRKLRNQNQQLRELVPEPPEPPELEGDENAEFVNEALNVIRFAKEKVAALPPVVREALFLHFHDAQPLSVSPFDNPRQLELAREAVEVGYLKWEEDDDRLVTIRREQPEVEDAVQALYAVREVVFAGETYEHRARAGEWIRPVLKEQFGITDPTFELRPAWENFGFL